MIVLTHPDLPGAEVVRHSRRVAERMARKGWEIVDPEPETVDEPDEPVNDDEDEDEDEEAER